MCPSRQAICTFSVEGVFSKIYKSNVLFSDNSYPTVDNCPDAIREILPYGSTRTSVSWEEPLFNDNDNTNVTVSHTPGGVFFVGVHTVEYVVADQSGNRASCSFRVEVERRFHISRLNHDFLKRLLDTSRLCEL